jgi:hypothetical protein
MAKLQIFNSNQNVQESATPRTSALALPLSLATQQGQAISSFAKAVGDIQNDLNKIENQNAVDRVKPAITQSIYEVFDKTSKENSTQTALKKYYELTNPSLYENLYKDQNTTVKKLIRNEILKQRDGLVPKLFTKVSTEQTNQLVNNLNDKFNDSIKKMLSNDQADMAIGSIDFKLLSENKFYEEQLGAKNFRQIVDDAQKLKNNLLLDLDTKINPRKVIESEQELIEKVGTDAAKDLIEKAKVTLRKNRQVEERKDRFEELADTDTKVGVFTNVLLRINNYQKNPTDEEALNELPTESELYDLLDKGLINEPMFAKLSVAMTDEDGFSDDETLALITTQIYSANTIEQLDEIEKAYIADTDTLKALNNRDLSLFSAYINKAKTDFESHKDFKAYSKLIDSNIANLSNLRERRSVKFAENIATRKQLIQMAFYEKVSNGMSPKDAYLDVLQNEFEYDAIPNLNNIPAPYYMKGVDYYSKIKDDPDYFAKQNKFAAELFNNSRKTNRDLQEYISNLSKLDFLEDVFAIRYQLAPGTEEDKLKEATQTGITSSLKLPE